MNRNRTIAWHLALRAALFMGLALLVAYLTQTGALGLYIAPKMRIYVKLAAIGLYAIAMYQAFAAFRAWRGEAAASCGCGHDPGGRGYKQAVAYALFALPLAVGFGLPDTVMGSAMADQKGMNFSAASQWKGTADVRIEPTAEEFAELEPAASGSGTVEEPPQTGMAETPNEVGDRDDPADAFAPTDIFDAPYADFARELSELPVIRVEPSLYMETLTAIDLFIEPLTGKQIEIVGFVYRTDQMEADQFAVGRFAMNCCSADAAPFGVLTEFEEANRFADDEWVKVTGTIRQTTFNDMTIMMIEAESAERAEQPDDPYVYPNYDF